jgi:hypothetical protein
MKTEEDRERLEFMLEQPNPRLRLYTLAQKRAAATVAPDTGFMDAMREIEASKTGG